MHLRGLSALGADIELVDSVLVAEAPNGLRGARITLDFPSVGATENIMMAAIAAKGTTVLDNAAREPEIVDLCSFLNDMGGQVEGVGTSTLTIHGVVTGDLKPVAHRVVPDRVEAATFLAAVAVAGGEIMIRDAWSQHMELFVEKLTMMGLGISDVGNSLWVRSDRALRSVDFANVAVPRHRNRLQTADRRDAFGRRQHRHRDRKPVLGAISLHRGTGEDGCRYHRRLTSRSDSQCAHTQGFVGDCPRHPCRGVPGRGGVGRSGRDRDLELVAHRSGLWPPGATFVCPWCRHHAEVRHAVGRLLLAVFGPSSGNREHCGNGPDRRQYEQDLVPASLMRKHADHPTSSSIRIPLALWPSSSKVPGRSALKENTADSPLPTGCSRS